MKRHSVGWSAALLVLAMRQAAAQDTTNAIRLGVRGRGMAQPGLAVLAGPGIDSVRAIVQRDLENSDRFTVAHLSDSAGTLHGPFDPAALKTSGLIWAVELEPGINGVVVKVYDITTGLIRQQDTRPLDASGVGDSRITIHHVSDLIVGWLGGIGVASTRVAFKLRDGKDDAIWRIDSDGANLVRISRDVGIALTPAWSPDGGSIAYSEYRDGRWMLYLLRLATGTRAIVPSSSGGNSYGPSFSPDGKTLVFTYGPEKGTDVESADVSRLCCAHRLTHDAPLADNLSPTYSPDGRRIAYVSTRTGTPEIYAMDADGTSVSQMVSSEFDSGGRALDTYSPAWSPDGARIAFSRDTPSGGRQLYSASVGSGQVVQLTSSGRNEDPSWAPDSRHVVFKSSRSGRDQLWILDLESGAVRQLATPGDVRFPAWSRVLGINP